MAGACAVLNRGDAKIRAPCRPAERIVPGKLVLVRHGQSTWNVENLFTGWTDVDLSEQGRTEAAGAGR